MRTWWYLVRIVRALALYFTLAVVAGVVYEGLPLVIGLAIQAYFDALSGHAPAGLNVWTALALVLAFHLADAVVLARATVTWIDLRYAGTGLLRANLLRQILRGPAALPLPDSPGEAISRFRDDAGSIMYDTIDGWVDLITRTVFLAAAFVVMLRINAPLTLAVAALLFVTLPIVILAGERVALYTRLNHEAISRVTGFLAEMFGAVQAIKVAGGSDDVVRHFEELGERRRQAAVRDQLWQAVVTAVNANVVTFGTGLVLLIAGQAIRTGTFTIGDFSLFVVYLTDLKWYPEEIARFITSYRQAGVSLARLAHLLGGGDPRTLVERPGAASQHSSGAVIPGARRSSGTSLPDSAAAAVGNVDANIPRDQPAPRRDVPLERLAPSNYHRSLVAAPRRSAGTSLLEARGLAYCHPSSSRGIQDVSLQLAEGSFAVITGRVGAGKTTLLQVLLGLLPRDAGEILWKGTPIADPTSFFGPPRSSYVPQTPRLFSETLRANVQQGWPIDDAGLARAARLAVLERDLAEFPDGWETLIGPRGARLSGGQIQRAAAARAFVRAPELLVLDDLSSALDLPTEELLWERLAQWRRESPSLTILAVSHRPIALRRADHVLTMEEGRIVEGV